MEDTIVAISTAVGVGAISIIRVSGKESITQVEKIYKGKNLKEQPSHTIHYGHIIDGENIIDEVLVSIMRGPKSFTAEDVVEINCHGGIASTNKTLELLIKNGCRLAEPGEFTKRAFLNGRIDLIEAESVMDVIHAKTEKSLKLAQNQLSGKVSTMIHDLRQKMIEVIANIAVNIDYPEYEDIEEITNEMLVDRVKIVKEEIKKILYESNNGKLIRNGIMTAIIGKPNVGKSSILNILLEENKAIVTEIAGTTRDIVEGYINIDGITLNLIDTAGIRETEDIVENIGVQKSKEYIEKADLILFVVNGNQKLSNEEIELLENIKKKEYLLIVNKADLEHNIDLSTVDESRIVWISALENKGINELKNKIKEIFELEKLETADLTYLSSARSIGILEQTLESINEIEKGIENNIPIDIIELDIKEAWNLLGTITGESYEDELIDQLFTQFCLGK